MSSIHDRRSFVSVIASLAGFAAVGSPAETVAAQAPARAEGGWDLTWIDQLKGQHRQVYDLGGHDLAKDPRPLRFVRNFLDTFRDVYRLDGAAVSTAVGISGTAFPMNASDRLWEKYRLGERSQIIDPATKQVAVRNIFFDVEGIGVRVMQARGTVFWQCNVALGAVAQRLADATKMPFDEVRADLIAGLNPGVRLVPSHVMALALVQERGFTYMKP